MRSPRETERYIVLAMLVLASAVVSLGLSWTSFGRQIDDYAYDFLFRLEQPEPWRPDTIILALDEATLSRYGGLRGMRLALAHGLELINNAGPAALAVDLILAEPGDSDSDARLEGAFAHTPKLVFSCDLFPDASGWEDPIPRFRKYAAGIGQVHADLDKYDAVSRQLPLEKVAGHDRRWALSLETYRAQKGGEIVESPVDIEVAGVRIPSSAATGRSLRIRYAPIAMGGIPRVSIVDLDRDPSLASQFTGKVVFAGVTAQTAVRDRWMTPYSNGIAMPGIEIHANAYETIARRTFLTDAPLWAVAGCCFVLAAGAALGYVFASGWIANLIALFFIVLSQVIPPVAFQHSLVWAFLPGTLATVITAASAAAWKHVKTRRQLSSAESERTRYQKTIHFVTHEMRTPLTAIQGSSELISRYGSMPETKRTQIAGMINTESKRLARMIETFLSVERLSAGQMDLKNEHFALTELVTTCTERARAIADGRQIQIEVGELPAGELTGDRELLEYAVYNLLTNAVKYSPPHTKVVVFGENERNDRVRLSVEDQGIGMERKDLDRIFDKFYRTKKAEQSGVPGSGIGLSLVDQIVKQHGGAIQVESVPGKGSRFTLVLKRFI